MKTRYVSPSLITEIKNKVSLLDGKVHVFNLALYRVYFNCLSREASIHSYKIENDNRDPPNEYVIGARKHTKGAQSLVEALNWGVANIDKSLDHNFIFNLAQRTDPLYFPDGASYRDHQVRITYATSMPPRPEKVYGRMDGLLSRLRDLLKEGTVEASIEAAAMAHMQFVRIHPLSDCNGRTARALQNIILKKASLPPCVIYANERTAYYKILDDAVKAERDLETTLENNISLKKLGRPEQPVVIPDNLIEFYDFIASRVLESLDKIITKFEVNSKATSKGILNKYK